MVQYGMELVRLGRKIISKKCIKKNDMDSVKMFMLCYICELIKKIQ